jgi:hypothetical protein
MRVDVQHGRMQDRTPHESLLMPVGTKHQYFRRVAGPISVVCRLRFFVLSVLSGQEMMALLRACFAVFSTMCAPAATHLLASLPPPPPSL